MVARPLPSGQDVAVADQRVFMRGVPWSHYEVLLALRGEAAVPRLSYLEGTLEIMAPSESHELIKSRLGRLVEVFLLHHDLEFEALGSWTLKGAPELAGAEPDECYKVGPHRSGDRPHLVIEVNWTHGGIDKKAIYARLGVPEMWIWQDDGLQVFVLRGRAMVRADRSELLPGIDLDGLLRHLDAPSASAAIKAYRAELEAR